MATTTINLTGVEKIKNRTSLLLIGDSITAQGYSSSPSLRYRNLGWWCWTLSYMGWNMDVKNVAATSGWTTSQVLADLETQLQTYSPDWVWGITGQNDLGLGSPLTVISDIESIIDLCDQYGAKLMLGTVTPRTVVSATITSDLVVINNGLRNFALQGRIILFDSHSCILDSTSTADLANVNYLYDTLHPNPTGAWRIGLEAYNKIKYFIPETTQSGGISNGDDRDTNSGSKILNKNCKLTGTSGTTSTGTSGGVANNFLLARSSGTGITAVGSKVLTSTYKDTNIQRIVFGGTSAGSDEIRFQQTIAISTFATAITPGTDKVKGRVTLALSGVSSNILNCRLVIESINSVPSATTLGISMIDNGFNLASAPSETFTIETPVNTIPLDCVSIRISVYTKFTSGSCTGTLDISDIFMNIL